ncbi:hypothetical protein D1B33_04425 [Lysinibacillus yapensis]|uniref:Spore coat protein n=1 Tax=Ureibacillus yapensis TaxID=2304605 RepID=A0A396SF67_9BACL|nr:hypothetical protein [Lysinibacillus yapensis]RHW40096.1 hypothetical protein D1B33_04425 [Lysinibacillus yapensis]
MKDNLGVHERLEIHELLTFKNLCLTKSIAMSELAQDEQLKQLLSQTAQIDRENIQALQGYLQ